MDALMIALTACFTAGAPTEVPETTTVECATTVSIANANPGNAGNGIWAYYLNVRHENRHAVPIWLVTRNGWYGEDRLPDSGRFDVGSEQPFTIHYALGPDKGGKGRALMMLMQPMGVKTSSSHNGFAAFLVPAHSSITIKELQVLSGKKISALEFWEASSIRVNGRTKLEDWFEDLPTSTANAYIPADTTWRWVFKPVPKEKWVTDVLVEPISKWSLPLK